MSSSENLYDNGLDMQRVYKILKNVLIYAFCLFYLITIFGPILLMVITSLKQSAEIFTNPFGLPQAPSLENYVKLFTTTNIPNFNFPRYFLNSIIVILSVLALILFLTILASYVLARYQFKGSRFLYSLFVAGMIIPIKLGTISLMKIMIGLGLFDNLIAIILVFTAFGIPFGVFILTVFIRNLPQDLFSAARVDGCSEERILFSVVIPLVKPAIATVSIVMFIPVWNEFWFPLILLKSDEMKTVPLATALLFGQYQTNYALVFAVLTLASIPVIATYLTFSKAFVKGISAGALKG